MKLIMGLILSALMTSSLAFAGLGGSATETEAGSANMKQALQGPKCNCQIYNADNASDKSRGEQVAWIGSVAGNPAKTAPGSETGTVNEDKQGKDPKK